MMDGSFVHLSPCDTKFEIGTTVSIAFVCGQVRKEAENPKSNANKLIWKLRNNLVLENVVTLTLLLYDKHGAPLKQDLISHRYDCSIPCIPRDYFDDPCYPHCHMNDSLQQRSKLEKALILSESEEVIRFLRKNKDVFTRLRKLRLVCFHYVNIPDDVKFMFSVSRGLKTIEKLDENSVGPVFDLNEPGLQHGYTPWRFTIG